ncbi:MAG: ParB/RepB/Spo0J family partition protein [Acidimicrobiia bacterium]|nr:ParB/RepB/Spo0J family partition protein [Acidimicrobiia bacterium]
MGRRSGLGKGLGALIPPAPGESESAYRQLPVTSIEPNPQQPRTTFDEESLSALAASVRELGVLQPVLVRQAENGSYLLIAGERRWRAAKRAGLQTVPAIVRTADDTASLQQALVENLQREDLNALDEAAAYQQLIEDFQLTHEEVATRVGKSRAAVSNALRLFQLPPQVQKLLVDGSISAGHARALLGTPDRAYQEALARRVVSEGLSVRAVEESVRERSGRAPTPAAPDAAPASTPDEPGKRLRPPGLLELEELLARHLDTRVKIEMGATKGRVLIEFATLEDLERIYRAMTEPEPASLSS